MDLHYELHRSNNSHVSECIKVYKNVFCSDWCMDLCTYFDRTEYTFRTDDHRKQTTEMQLIGDKRAQAVDYKNELFERLYPLGSDYEKYLQYRVQIITNTKIFTLRQRIPSCSCRVR